MNAVEIQLAKVLPDIFQDEQSRSVPAASVRVDAIPEGQRDATLAARAGMMRRKGFSVEAIAAALHVVNVQCCQPPLSSFEVEKIARSIGRYAPGSGEQGTALVGLTLDALATHVFPNRKAVFTRAGTPVFCEGHIGQVYAERGFGKTWFLQTLALVAATGTEALGFHSPEACRVLYVDGEMASQEIRDRFALLQDRLRVQPTPRLSVVAADWQEQVLPRLDTEQGQVAVEPFIEAADLVIIDNRSCLFDPEAEKDPSAWQPAQDWLLSLRRRGKSVLVAHHSNRQGGARGHSKSEDLMNLLIKLARPEDYCQDQGARFIATFDKCRGAYGPAVASFMARLTPDGWLTESVELTERATVGDKLLEYVRLAHEAGERVKSANAAIAGARVGRNAGLAAWADLIKRGDIRKHHEGGFCA